MSAIRICRDGEEFGPYSDEECRALLAQGALGPADWAWREGWGDWVALEKLLAPVPLPLPPPFPLPPSAGSPNVSYAGGPGTSGGAVSVRWAESSGGFYPPTLPAIVAPPAASLPRGIGVRDLLFFAVISVACWNVVPESVIVPVFCLSGIALCYYATASVPALRRAYYATRPPTANAASARAAERGTLAIAFVLALLSLLLWVPLFTFSDHIFWTKLNKGLVLLWFINSWLYGYLFLLSRTWRSR